MVKVPKDKQIDEFIIDAGLLPEEDLKTFQEKSDKEGLPLFQVLLREGKLTDDELRRTRAHLQGIPFVNLKPEKIDFKVLSLIPEPIAREHNVIAYKKDGDNLEVAMLDAGDLSVIDFIKKKVRLKILPRLTDKDSILSSLAQYKKSLKAEFDDIIKKESAAFKAVSDGSERDQQTEGDLKKMAEDLPVIKIVDTLISHAILQKASDIHIEATEQEIIVRYRVDGILHDAMKLPKDVGPSIVARIKVLSNLKLDEKRLPQDGRFKLATDTQKVSFRVSTLPTFYGEKVVLRILNESSYGFTLEGLGFYGEALERIHRAMRHTTGMILVSGPTGSGKTTTLYTILDILNTPEVNISTVEDPIEYQMARVNQTQVRPDINFTFADGLRSLLRQDPDIIMVGEIRDGETASLGINASLTGHLVLSTIHTNSAAGVMPRLADMGIESFLLASTLRTVVAQRLVRKLCHDKEEYNMNADEIASLGKVVDLDRVLQYLKDQKVIGPDADWKTIPFYRPKETADCKDGYSGRLGIHEVLEVSETIKELIMKNADADMIAEQAKKEGMMTMLEDGIYWAAKGMTSIEEVLRVISE
jgi:type IV pilus assembly protein PilB